MTNTTASPSITKQIAALRRMSPKELRAKYEDLFGERSRSGNRQFLIKRIAWRLQSLEEGSISQRALRRAEELANESHVRINPPRRRDRTTPPLRLTTSTHHDRDPRLPSPGTVISRKYKGGEVRVLVNANNFEYDGEVFRSLSAIAKRVTGSAWNGFHFFNLGGAA